MESKNAKQFDILWHDEGREPREKPNPRYPEGKDVDLAAMMHATKACITPLPYPARRIGHYLIHCRFCGLRTAVTTAGRPDDPRSVRLPCKPRDASTQEKVGADGEI
jgi:hypothetical protein